MTLLDALRLLRKSALLILLLTLLGAGAALAWTFTRPTVYQAQSIGIVVAGDTDNVTNATTGQTFAQTRAQEYLNLIGTKAVAKRVADDLRGQGLTPGGYTATNAFGTSFVTVTATGTTGKQAQATADSALRALTFEALRVETYAKTKGAERTEEEMTQLTSVHILPYEPATAPTSPVHVDMLRNLAIGLVAGLALGVILAFIRSQLDTKVRTQSDIETLTNGRPVLGIVPDNKALKRKAGLTPLSGQVGEAMRKLRTNLRYVHVDDPVRSLVVTSANPGEGKSTMASNLARLLALSGQRVVLIDCDLRRPMQATLFKADASVGLAQVLSGDVDVESALQDTDIPMLKLLPAGRVPPNPSELAGSRKMSDLIAQLSEDSLVIVDTPPMLAVTDASLITTATDGALVVALAGKTPKEHVRICAKQLDLVGGSMLGAVLNRVPKRAFSDIAYGYSSSYYQSRNEKYYASRASTAEVVVAAPDAPAVAAPRRSEDA